MKVADFGVAKAATEPGPDHHRAGSWVPSRYLSPEQVEGGALGRALRPVLRRRGAVRGPHRTGPVRGGDRPGHGDHAPDRGPHAAPRGARRASPAGLEKVIMHRAGPRPRAAVRLGRGDAPGDRPGPRRQHGRDPRGPAAAPTRAPAPARDEHGHDEPSFFRPVGLDPPRSWWPSRRRSRAVGLLLGQLGVGGPLGPRPGRRRGRRRELTIASAADFDPDGATGRRTPARSPWPSTARPRTAWETDRYNSALLGGLKSGVGLRVELESEARDRAGWVESDAGRMDVPGPRRRLA